MAVCGYVGGSVWICGWQCVDMWVAVVGGGVWYMCMWGSGVWVRVSLDVIHAGVGLGLGPRLGMGMWVYGGVDMGAHWVGVE